ncbi:hypothetical protein D3C73_1369750 [compost metagenome]
MIPNGIPTLGSEPGAAVPLITTLLGIKAAPAGMGSLSTVSAPMFPEFVTENV